MIRRFVRPALWVVVVTTLVPLAGPGRALGSTDRECLEDYIRARRDPGRSLKVLRRCAAEHPESAVVQLTLARRLLRLRATADWTRQVEAEASAALERAARLDPAQVGEDWLPLADLLEAQGRDREALAALRAALPYATREQADGVVRRIWELAIALGDDEAALAAWDRLRYLRADDFECHAKAASMLAAKGDLDAARLCWERALELRPGSRRARLALCALQRRQEGLGPADRKARLEACSPLVDDLDAEAIDGLLEDALAVYRAGQALDLAQHLLALDPDHPLANLVLAEEDFADLRRAGRFERSSPHGSILARARAALRGDLDAERRARARAILGTALAMRARSRYSAGGGGATDELVKATRTRYLEALGHLRSAREGGQPVDATIAEVEASLATLGVMTSELERRDLDRREADCESRARSARQGYEMDRPLEAMAREGVGLSAGPAEPAGVASLTGGASVRVLDADWAEGRCWLKVRAPDGRRGWAPSGSFRP